VGTEVGTAAGIDSGTDDAADDAQEVVTKSPPGPSGSSSTSAAAERRPAVRQPVADPPPSAVSRYRDALIEAIDAANEEQNYAQETLDVSGLADIFTGAALQLHVATVGQLFQSGEVSFNTLLSQRYGEFRVDPTETVAEVDVVERWTAEHRNALTGMCMHRIPPWDVPQTVHFRRVGSGWIIENVTGDPVTVPDAVGC
jgi:hypothetical protein